MKKRLDVGAYYIELGENEKQKRKVAMKLLENVNIMSKDPSIHRMLETCGSTLKSHEHCIDDYIAFLEFRGIKVSALGTKYEHKDVPLFLGGALVVVGLVWAPSSLLIGLTALIVSGLLILFAALRKRNPADSISYYNRMSTKDLVELNRRMCKEYKRLKAIDDKAVRTKLEAALWK